MRTTIIGAVLFLALVGCEPNGAETPLNPGAQEETAPSESSKANVGEISALTESRFTVAFDAESRDQSWAANFEALVRTTMQKSFNDSTLQTIECRSTLCKIVVDHPGAKAQALWARTFTYRLLQEMPPSEKPVRWTKETTVSPSMDQTTVYLTRNGYAEPLADGSPRRLLPPIPGPAPVREMPQP